MALWKQEHIRNKASRPEVKLACVNYLVWHYTANLGATARNHKDYFGRQTDRKASAHIFVDKDEAIEIIPLDEIAYHAGNAMYNKMSIGIELCIEKDGSFHPDTMKRAAQIGAELCKRFGLASFTKNIRHYDVTKKVCPKPWVDNPQAFIEFKQEIMREVEQMNINEVEVLVNGKPLKVKGIEIDGVSYTPNRALAEALGLKIDWDGRVLFSTENGTDCQ